MKRSIKLVILAGLLVLSAGLAYAESTINLPQTGETDPRSWDTDGDGVSVGVERSLVAPEGKDTDLGLFKPDGAGILVSDTGDIFELPGWSGSGCGAGIGPTLEMDFDGNGIKDTLVVVFSLTGQTYMTTFNQNRMFYMTPAYCSSDGNARAKIRFVDMLDMGFNPDDESSWVYKSILALRINGSSDNVPVADPAIINIYAYREINQTDRITPLYGTLTGGGTKVFSDSSRIKEIYIRTGYAENNIDNLILMATAPNTLAGTDVTAVLENGSVTFPEVTIPGNTFIIESDTGDPPPTAVAVCAPWPAPPYFLVETNADTSSPGLVCVHYPDTCNESGLALLRYITICGLQGCMSYWDDVTESMDTATNSICASYAGFKPFVVAHPIADNDGDGVTNVEDCNDNDATVYPGAPEICDGKDNDCNPTTADGSEEVWVGDACDGPDSDLCIEGTYSCSGGQQVCSDNTGDNIEICDGLDNDCNSATADGSGEVWIGDACDGPDSDLCLEGTYTCTGGQRVCSDTTDDTIEICDGLDNDCNPVTPDGSAEAWIGDPCDGPDSDLCSEGIFICTGRQKECSDTTDDTVEVCDNIDNDCDGQVDEDLPILTFYYDSDDDGFGDRNTTQEGCGPSADYVADSSDCDDSDPGIGSCNTPPGSDSVTVTDPATGMEINFPNVENGGNTTVVSSDVGADPPPNFRLGDFEYSYYDINCQTGDGSDCTWSHSSFVLVCFTWEEGDFIFDDFVRIFQENEGRWDDVTCEPGFGECPDPNPDTENNRVCAYVDHLSWFGVFQNIGLEISLAKGLNFISYAGEIPSGLSSHDLLKQLGTPDTIKRILTYSPISGTYSVSFYDTEGNSAGDDGMVTNFWALQVYAKQQQDARFFYTSLCQQPTPLIKGRNEAGFNCIPPGYSAYTFLQDIGQSAVVSVQRFNKITGLFETASFKDGAPVGVDFPMQEGEGYLVFMKQNYAWIAPAP